jgi:hypothetical protein
MMMLLAIYTTQRESRAMTKDERLVAAEQARLVRQLRSARKAKRAQEQGRLEKPVLKRLLASLGQAGA